MSDETQAPAAPVAGVPAPLPGESLAADAFTPPPGSPWAVRLLLARERLAVSYVITALRWAQARELVLWGLLCETYEQFGQQLFPHITDSQKLHIAAAAFVVRGLLHAKPPSEKQP